MSEPGWLYLLPFIPLVTRLGVGLFWHWLMPVTLPEEAQERDTQRAVILALAGFTFTAVAALAVLDTGNRPSLQLSIWYALASFVSFLGALNLQSYKYRLWQDELATALIEIGSLSLVLTLATLLMTAKLEPWFLWTASSLALGSWLVDHCVKLRLFWRYLEALDARARRGGKDGNSEEGRGKKGPREESGSKEGSS